ncbi:hypothetical protein BKA66DRAFT_446951 [Pyrenochaeta sp. MPI-SDFR-AT-0127]|nr:hypothetical protein BKA66DRAFT_446951 [Pyrenochaeta sp. MPI-SDFR-AT-0127]
MSAMAAPTPKQYTILLFTPSIGTPPFLHNLQKSSINPLWIGEHAIFYRKDDPSKWLWSHIMLVEGHNIQLPTQCPTAQTWSFEIETSTSFVPDADPDESHAHGLGGFQQWSTGMPKDTPSDLAAIYQAVSNSDQFRKRFCVLNIATFTNQDNEQKYRDHLSDVAHDTNLDARTQLVASLTRSQPSLGPHAKSTSTSNSNKSFWRNVFPSSLRKSTAIPDPIPPSSSSPSSTLLSIISFPNPASYAHYLISANRKTYEAITSDAGNEEMILTKHLHVPSLEERQIDPGDWTYGNPWEPCGHDFFG